MLAPSTVSPTDYAAIYYAGGHGVVWDFPDNAELQAISRKIYEAGGIVSSVCHGAAGLLNIKLSDGTLLIKGKRVTGFSNAEEKLAELDKLVPFLTESEMVARERVYRRPSSRGRLLRWRMCESSPDRIQRPAVRSPIWLYYDSRPPLDR